ncbi:MAG: virulence factor [Ilumatobacteraceae bacterium]
MPRNASEVVVIYWRDIPAQVNAQRGRERQQVVLGSKFARAIDRAKRKARIDTAAEDVAQWRRVSVPLEGTLEEAAQREASRLDADYPRERLGKLAYAGGWERDVEDGPVDAAELAALEELDDTERDE